ncbi:PKD domain-containing protein [Lapillicoccus jejuensis]|uniref:PKD domain-containing protein n=1 Tax=Lapillicoccus jejuensis TaxID=402171 RepID=A0A542E4G9_9MICO|nr:PKD domain-containing protein [Lapillicoccus jejuensis]TQJ10240.1 hypothetical protein FB458_3360 [Lapillicoccus jejuensis]
MLRPLPRPHPPLRRRLLTALGVLVAGTALAASGPGAGAVGALAPAAVLPTLATSTQFDITGFIQSATLDTPDDPHSGGVLKVNGHSIVIPRETIAILPASALTWQELFTHAPDPWKTAGSSGLALEDDPKPPTTYEVNVIGNRVIDGTGDRYVAGLVHISQQDLNTGTGYISYIDYSVGEMEVGGRLGVQGTGTRVRINDPGNPTALDEHGTSGSGRYGRAGSPDDRFQVDQDNPTILAETGFPMCLPRVTADPTVAGNPDDPQCPQANRPVYTGQDTSGITPQVALPVAGGYYTLFRMDTPANVDSNTCVRGTCADPRKQAPFEIGDFVSFAGSLEKDAAGTSYVSAHTITASLGIYTAPGVDPAYVSVEVSLLGTGGLTVFGAGEAAVRTRIEGMSTDESRLIRLYGVDVDPTTGATSDRDWGTVLPDQGPPTGAVRGRWRFRPPCTAAVATTKACTPPAAGQFLPVTREVRAVVDGHSQYQPGGLVPNPGSQVPGTLGATTYANGIYWGQYHAPIGEYIFPENVPGSAVPENNFNTIPFLAYGGYTSVTGTLAGVLGPWPSSVPPPVRTCPAPAINGAPLSVANGGSLKLSGSVADGVTTPVTLQWTVGTIAGDASLTGALTGATTTTPTLSAVGIPAGDYVVTFSAANPCGVETTTAKLTVTPAPPPSINPITDLNVTAGALVTLTATSPAVPAPTWTWTQTAGPAGPVLTQTPSAGTATGTSTLRFTPTVAGTYTYSVTATNANGTSSPTTVKVNVAPSVPVNITLNNVYRTSKQRLVITATSTDVTVSSMKLLPYLTETGTVFDPATLGAAGLTVSVVAPGSFTVTAVGAPPPACKLGGTYATPCSQQPLTVKALNGVGAVIGTSPPSPLTTIRQ